MVFGQFIVDPEPGEVPPIQIHLLLASGWCLIPDDFESAPDGRGGALGDGGGFFRTPVETQNLATPCNNPQTATEPLHSVAFGSISLRSTGKGALFINPLIPKLP